MFNQFSIRKKFWKAETRAFQPYYQILCTLKYVEDVKDRSSTLKGCNAMYVKDIEDGIYSIYATLHLCNRVTHFATHV